MARPPLPVGAHGKINVREVRPGRFEARCRFRDTDGFTRPEGLTRHTLIRHGSTAMLGPLARQPLCALDVSRQEGWEGIVWWRDPADPDCDKAKLKVRDLPHHQETR